MKYLVSALALLALLPLQANAATRTIPASQMMRNTLGTFTCTTDGRGAHKSTFSPLFGGKAMEISEMSERGLVSYDRSRSKWIYMFIGADGSYATMEGTTVPGGGIDFVGVYPSAVQSTLHVRYANRNHFTARFSMTMNGRSMNETETCVR